MGYRPREIFSIIRTRSVVRQYDDGRVLILDQQSNQSGAKMSKIQEVTSFMRDDVAEMNRQAEEVHNMAIQVKATFGTILAAAKDQLTQAQKDLMELQAAMGQGTNFPPA